MGNMCSSLTEEERLAKNNIAGKSAEEERVPHEPQTRAVDPPMTLDTLREVMGPAVFERMFTDDQLERYNKGEKHFFVSATRGGARYDDQLMKEGDLYFEKAAGKPWEERAQEVHTKLQFFGMHSFVVPLRQEESDPKAGASADDGGGAAALIQFGSFFCFGLL